MRIVLFSGPTRVEVDPSRGGDIFSYTDERVGGDILWNTEKTDAPEKKTTEIGHNTQAFYDDYRGGIQELFPNTADATTVRGAELPFHGELCRTRMEITEQSDTWVTLSAELRRYPVQVTRKISIDERGKVHIRSEVCNLSPRELPYSWGLHPVFSEKLTKEGSHLWCRTREAFSHPEPFANHQFHPPGSDVIFAEGELGNSLRLSPGDSGTADLIYVALEENWFQLGLAAQPNVRVSWSNVEFRYLWLWQECHGSDDYPWWGQHHIVGVEPHTAAPATSLADHIDQNRHLILPALGRRESEFVFEVVPGHEMKGMVKL